MIFRHLVPCAIGLAIIAVSLWLGRAESFGRESAFAWIAGAVFGLALQRSRFCFFCNFRDAVEKHRGGGLLGIFLALAVGLIGYHVITSAWIVDPHAGFIPPKAHIAPIGWHLVFGGAAFGLGMALSGSCISAHLYRLGEGALVCLLTLVATCAGFFLGFLSWNPIYTTFVAGHSPVWLPQHLGFAGALGLQLAVLGALTFWIWKREAPLTNTPTTLHTRSLRSLWARLFGRRWPGWVGGLIVGALAAAVLLRIDPLGVTAEISRLVRMSGDATGVLPERLEGLDQMRGCSARAAEQTLSRGALFVIALILSSLTGALFGGDFELEIPNLPEMGGAISGGILLGWGSMVSLGCTVGTLLSGIHASSLSGWLFGASVVAGTFVGLPLRRWITSHRI